MSIRTALVTGVDAWPAMSVQPADVKFVPAVSESTTPPPVAGWSTPEPGSGTDGGAAPNAQGGGATRVPEQE